MNPEDLFSCTQCGTCCKGYGGTYVSGEDIAAIGHYLNIPSEQVRLDYCVPSGQSLVLSQRSDGYCIFWDNNCTIHRVKPRMCRQWPFISGLRADPFNWQIMADMCPGIRRDVTHGQLISFLNSISFL